MKIAKMMILAATLTGAFQANAICSQLLSANRGATKAQSAQQYLKQINGTTAGSNAPITPPVSTSTSKASY